MYMNFLQLATRRKMNTHKLAALIFILFLISGCQQAQMTAQKPVSDQTLNSEDASYGNVSSLSAIEHKAIPTDTREGLSLNCDIQANQNVNNAVAPDQNNIDQALELCTIAQKSWEEGELEEALSSLDAAYALIIEIDPSENPEVSQQKEDIRYLISKRVLEIYASRQIIVTGQHEEIPITLNSHVNAEIKRLTGPERNFFIRSLNRSCRYRPYIVQELKKAGLPEEISWLPLIESGFRTTALSSARALGLWQFISSTGHKFGLNRNYYIDERMDPEKATQAAISYFKELHNLFGDWTTALAAYNCGEYRVLKTIRRQKINYLDNFWDLYQNLPRETARYVPRFLATIHIVRNLDKYNITMDAPLKPIEYKSFNIKKQVRLSEIAKALHIETSILTDLNPELRHKVVPPDSYSIKIPVEYSDQFTAQLEAIKTTYRQGPSYAYYRVRRGDTLSGIAGKFHTSVRAISQCNNISRNSCIMTGKLLKIPSSNYRKVATHSDAASQLTSLPSGEKITYKVCKGDNLWLIAKKFSTTTRQIMHQNNLSNTNLNIGQCLKIVVGNTDLSPAKKTATYKVRSGDSPFIIAKKHNMSLDRLLALNHLNKRSKIYPGQDLIVE